MPSLNVLRVGRFDGSLLNFGENVSLIMTSKATSENCEILHISPAAPFM